MLIAYCLTTGKNIEKTDCVAEQKKNTGKKLSNETELLGRNVLANSL